MAFVLDKLEDMINIYEVAKKVYAHEISVDNAVSDLMKKTEAKSSSLKMYFNIYAKMRDGKCYKMGTSAGFTKFLLEHIFSDFGEDALLTALIAAKLHAEYRVSVNNEQPGIEKVCREIISEKQLSIVYDSLPSYQSEEISISLSEDDKLRLLDAIRKSNAEFSVIIMTLLEKYNILNDIDIALLCDRQKSREIFASDYAYFKKIDVSSELSPQLKSPDGRNRYYGNTYVLNEKTYVMTSQLYGLGSGNGHKNNRNPFYEWILDKFGVVADISDWWPSQGEYSLNLTKDDWKKYLFEIELPSHPSPIKMLKGMMELGNEASCKQLSDTYGGHPSVYAGCAMNLGRRVKKYFNLPACMDGDQERYFPFPFVGKYRGGSEDNYIYKIRPELSDALKEIDLSSISPYYDEEHKLGKFDSWEIINETTAIKTCDKSFFDHNGSGVPKGICWFFDAEDIQSGESKAVVLSFAGDTYSGKLRNDTTDRRRIQILWGSDLGKKLENYNTPGATATFKKIDENIYEISMSKEGEKMTTKEKVSAIKFYIASKGFNYEGNLIENFYLSLKSKPFVILAGTSGTGKTRLVKLFAEAINAKMLLVPVRPDWSDSSDLFGHVDLSGEFNPGAILEFIKEAQDNIDKPYFLCLDEMNLARVEYYFSDFLSIIETRENIDGRIVSDPLVDEKYYKKDTAAAEKYGKIIIPENLYIIGTVNMDETTFPFSKKVLDRANTIEFSFVDLMAKPVQSYDAPKQLDEDNSFLKTEYLYLNDVNDENVVTTTCFELEQLNQILLKANLHVGYRVRDEITFYMSNNKNADNLISETAAFDNQIMQKILPRIQGSSSAIKEVLIEMFQKCAGDYSGLTGSNTYEQMINCIETKECKYPNSAKKIAFMVRRFEEDGFTSYWL